MNPKKTLKTIEAATYKSIDAVTALAAANARPGTPLYAAFRSLRDISISLNDTLASIAEASASMPRLVQLGMKPSVQLARR